MSRRFLLALLVTLAFAGVAHAQTSFVARVSPAQEVPATGASTMGVVYGTLDTSNNLVITFQHTVTASAAHIHTAPAGSNGAVVFPFSSFTSPTTQSFSTTSPQRGAFFADGMYLNVHSPVFPGGEIRGQLVGRFGAGVYINEYCNDPLPSAGPGIDTNLDGVLPIAAAQTNDEFVEIVNFNSVPVDISGWELGDGAMPIRHVFAPGTVLPPFGAIVVFGGGNLTNFNASGATGVAASTGMLGLNNGGDSIFLRNGSGVTIDSVSYSSGGPGDGNGESVNRGFDNGGAAFSVHTLTQAAALAGTSVVPTITTHSPGRLLDNTFFWAAATINLCGNGAADPGEACDDGADNGTPTSCCTTMCTLEAAGTMCDDGAFCTATDTCDSVGACTGTGNPCDDTVACTTDTCVEATSSCTITPVNAACDDADVCNGAETCSAITGCVAGTALACDDGNACNGTETCDATMGCQMGAAPMCDDGDVCNGMETCDATMGCVAGTALACDDGNACNGAEMCDATMGCMPGTAPMCDDGDPCNGTETCDAAMGCVDGTALSCDDGDACTTDTCDPAAGCQNVNMCADGGLADGGPSDADGGTEADGGVGMGVDGGPEMTDGGCSCRVGARRSPTGALFLMLVIGAVIFRRRRR